MGSHSRARRTGPLIVSYKRRVIPNLRHVADEVVAIHEALERRGGRFRLTSRRGHRYVRVDVRRSRRVGQESLVRGYDAVP